MARHLTRSKIKSIITELEQTAVAVSVMGTSTRKLKEMADLVEPIADELIGMRPDVRRVRTELYRLVQNVRVSSVRATIAASRLRQMASGLRKVQGLLDKGIGDAEAEFKVGSFEVSNVWGYGKTELGGMRNALGDASRQLDRVGLPKLASAHVSLDPSEAAEFVVYDPSSDSLLMNLRRQGGPSEVLRGLAARLWKRRFNSEDRLTWGGDSGLARFQQAFAELITGKRVDADARARLQVTVGVGV